jgi:type IV pilus assembly protein PilC
MSDTPALQTSNDPSTTAESTESGKATPSEFDARVLKKEDPAVSTTVSAQEEKKLDTSVPVASAGMVPKKPIRPFSNSAKTEEKPEVFLASSKVDARKKEVEAEEVEKKRPRTVTEQTREKKAKNDENGSKFLNIKIREKIVFAKHLAIMLDSGIPLKEALEVMLGQVSTKNLQRMLTVMIRDLSDGFTLSSSLEKFPRVFKPFSVSIIRVGESSGTLPNALHYQAQQLEKSKDLEGKIRGAMMYPMIIFFGAIGIGGFLSFGVLPKMMPMFTSLGVELPAMTRALLAMSSFVTTKWPIVIGIVAVAVTSWIILYRMPIFKLWFHTILLRVPVFGPLIRAVQVAFFTRILGILLSSGVQIVQAIAVTATSASNLAYRKKLQEISERVERGEAITDELEKTPSLFPRMTTGMIKVGDRTGHLAESLMNAAEFCEKEVDEETKTLATLIEPLTLILVGGMVGFIMLAIITPIYKITEGVKM